MAIAGMRRISICGLKEDRKAVLEKIQSMGVMEIDDFESPDDALKKTDTQGARASFERSVNLCEQALGILDQYAPEKKGLLASFSGKEIISRKDYEKVVMRREKTVDTAGEIVRMDRAIAENKAQIGKNEAQIEAILPWKSMDLPMNFNGTERTKVLIGTMPPEVTLENIYALLAERCPQTDTVSVDIVNQDNDAVYLAVTTLNENASEIEEALRSGGFSKPAQLSHRTPLNKIEKLSNEIERLNKKNEELTREIVKKADARKDLKRASDYFRTRSEKYEALGKLPQSDSAFFISGYIPADVAQAFEKALDDEFDIVVEIEELPEDDEGPTLLKNNKLSESVEGVLESYGLPTRGHVDPSLIMSVFYVIFFGMMFSDAGYGIIMMIGCGLVLLKFGKTLSSGMHKMVKLFFMCGISTAFWGFMYGSFFGDAIDVVAKTFFGYTGSTPILKPLWFEPMAEPMRLLIWCMAFGLIHLFCGLGIKGWEYLKNKDFVGFISDVFSWFIFIIGLVLLLLPSDLFGSIAGDAFDFTPLKSLNLLAKVLTFGGLILIIFMQERAQRNWVLRFLLGLYDVYGVSGWLSDVLSYSRLLALGLATGVIAQVINMMGSIGGGGIGGAIMFIIVFIVGHALNFAINVLGAYVHTNRLQFVEFFGKFYEGGGRPFEAFQTANKYTEVKEEN